jgi:hypothetical protein
MNAKSVLLWDDVGGVVIGCWTGGAMMARRIFRTGDGSDERDFSRNH